MVLSNLFLSYLAGFIDAEGSFSTTMAAGGSNPDKKYIRGQLDIRSQNLSILELVEWRFGGLVRATKKVKQQHNQAYLFTLHGPRLLETIPLLSDKLVAKKPQALLLMSLLKTKGKGPQPLPDRVIRVRNSIAKKLKELKQVSYEASETWNYAPNLEEITPDEWAYISGFLDGDGRVALENTALRFSFYNNNPKVLQWIQRRIGGHLTRPQKRKSDLTQPYKLYIPLKLSLQVLPHLTKYMLLKKRLAELCLEIKTRKSTEDKLHIFDSYRQEFQKSAQINCRENLDAYLRKE